MTTFTKPGILVLFEDEIWFHPVATSDDIQPALLAIRTALVDPVNQNRALKAAVKVEANDFVKIAGGDLQDMMVGGLTIRPCGK